jgi:hypothetical protein
VVDRHLQIAQSADDPRRPDLIGPAAAIAAGRIDVGRLDQPHLVVMPQRLYAQVRRAEEPADT